jgi:hypothetical protein
MGTVKAPILQMKHLRPEIWYNCLTYLQSCSWCVSWDGTSSGWQSERPSFCQCSWWLLAHDHGTVLMSGSRKLLPTLKYSLQKEKWCIPGLIYIWLRNSILHILRVFSEVFFYPCKLYWNSNANDSKKSSVRCCSRPWFLGNEPRNRQKTTSPLCGSQGHECGPTKFTLVSPVITLGGRP